MQKSIESFPILLDERFRPVRDSIQVIERNYAQQFSNVHRSRAIKIVDLPHALRQFRFSQHPAATDPAQTVSFGEAAGHNELTSEVKGRRRRAFEQRLEINLVYQHTRSHAARDLSHF